MCVQEIYSIVPLFRYSAFSSMPPGSGTAAMQNLLDVHTEMNIVTFICLYQVRAIYVQYSHNEVIS